MGSTRMWLLLAVVQLLTLALLASMRQFVESHPLLVYLGWACAAGLFLCIPPLALKGFIAGQLKAGNGALPMVRGVQQHESAVIVGVWCLMITALLMALPRVRADIRAEQEAQGASDAMNALAADSQKYTVAGAARSDGASAANASHSPAPIAVIAVTTPAAGSPQRTAILDALRNRLKSKGKFRVDHIRVAGNWAFVRATEAVELDHGELQETDNTLAALLELPAASTSGWWRVADIWTLPDDSEKPLAEFMRRVRQRLAAEGLPASLLPGDM